MVDEVFSGNNIVLKDFLLTFEETTGLTVCLYDFKERSEGNRTLSVDGSSFMHKSTYCSFVKSSKTAFPMCFSNDHDGLSSAIRTGRSYVKKCHAGLDEIVVPVLSNGKYLGCILAGQVFFKEPTPVRKTRMVYHLKSMGLPEKKAEALVDSIQVIPKKKLTNATNLLKVLVNFIIDSDSKQEWENELKTLKAGMSSGKDKFLAKGVVALKNARMKSIIDASMKALEAESPEKITLDIAAKNAGLSKFYFTRVFKAQRGVSFRDYLNSLKVERAKMLMQDAALNLSDIAYKCGYKDLSSFSRAFFKAVGSYPGVYRKINYKQ